MKSNSQKTNSKRSEKPQEGQAVKCEPSGKYFIDQFKKQQNLTQSPGYGGGIREPRSAIGAIEVNPKEGNSKYAGTTDVRFLKVALQYPYMFNATTQDMRIDQQWAVAFTLACAEIDAYLGKNKRGFRWTMLAIEDGNPYWYWSLGREYDQQVLVEDLYFNPSVTIQNSANDPKNEIRDALTAIVKTAIRRARFFSTDAANEGELQ